MPSLLCVQCVFSVSSLMCVFSVCSVCVPQVRVLQCVSVAVELMGDKVKPHLGTISTALPQVRGSQAGGLRYESGGGMGGHREPGEFCSVQGV